MLAVSDIGGIIAPPVPAFYNNPRTVDDLVNQTIGRVLDLFDIDLGSVKRWGESTHGQTLKQLEQGVSKWLD